MISLTAPRSLRAAGAALLTCAALTLGACGDDDEGRVEQDTASTTTAPSTTPTETAPTAETEAKTQTETAPEPGGSGGTGGAAPGEEQEGGAGDEIGASSQALVTGRGGKLSPRRIRVPPFIAIRVELRSADGRAYELRARGKTLRADGDIASASTSFAGLRPGRKLVLTGPAGRVVVEASAEPGP